MSERFAIYFAPPAANALNQRAAEWLGRDPSSEVPVEAHGTGVDPLHLRGVTRSARRYGFHATVKAPFALAHGTTLAKLEEALEFFTRRLEGVAVGPVELRLLDGFLALVPIHQEERLTHFVQTVVEAFEPFRAPLSAADREARISRGGLTERHIELLDRFGYHYTAEEFRFHMTLTDRLVATDREDIVAAAEKWFASVVPDQLYLDGLSLFHEAEPGAPFRRTADFPLSISAKV
jgi:Protein of unknown function (DUF1045)